MRFLPRHQNALAATRPLELFFLHSPDLQTSAPGSGTIVGVDRLSVSPWKKAG